MSTNERKKKMSRVVPALVVLLCLAAGLYAVFSRRLITALYEGRVTVGGLNRVIAGQRFHPLQFYLVLADNLFLGILLAIPVLLIIYWAIFRRTAAGAWIRTGKLLERHTDAIDAFPDARVGLWIALAAGLGLFIELLIIRLHSSYFQLFAYFKNVSLLSCFLGLGIGYARGSRRPLHTPLVLPFLALQIVFMYVLRYSPLANWLQQPISEQLTLGIAQASSLFHILVAYSFLFLIFSFNALCFIPLGHLASRLMMRRQNLVAYSWNLVGSLLGILLFAFISFMWAPPSVWLVLAALALLLFFQRDVKSLLVSVIAVAVALVFIATPSRLNQLGEYDIYSPYQILSVEFTKDLPPTIKASNTYYQRIQDLRAENIEGKKNLQQWDAYYSLPYSVKPHPQDVLIVGAGSGNDVAAALRNGASRIDAVEIDPAILQFGRQLHPEAPYQADNVNAIVNDARAFIRHTDRKYDLIVYGLLDSHTLLSGKSGGIRLDSYVYTVEGFREARERLNEGGMLSVSFALINDSLGRKLYLMLQEAFDGQRPVVYQASKESCAFLMAEELTQQLLRHPPALEEVTGRFSDETLHADVSTDDWPFFYMPVKKYPISYVIMLLILLAISAVFILRLVPESGSGFSAPCFFLGAGFMLVETKGITELALVYGSTWFVTSVVIVAILIMAFLANLLVMRIGNPRPTVTYGLVCASLLGGMALAFADSGGLPAWLNRLMMTAVLTLPLFFSGFAFSAELKKTVTVAVAFSSNLLGAMLGGFLEYNSMYFGFRSLYYLALVMYILAFIGSSRARSEGNEPVEHRLSF